MRYSRIGALRFSPKRARCPNSLRSNMGTSSARLACDARQALSRGTSKAKCEKPKQRQVPCALPWLLTLHLILCGVKQAEHRSSKWPKRRPCLSEAQRSEFGCRATLGDTSYGTMWADACRPRKARVGHMDVPQSGAQGTGDGSTVTGAAPVADGFGYFCLNKSNPRDSAEAFDLQNKEQRPWIPAFAGMTIEGWRAPKGGFCSCLGNSHASVALALALAMALCS